MVGRCPCIVIKNIISSRVCSLCPASHVACVLKVKECVCDRLVSCSNDGELPSFLIKTVFLRPPGCQWKGTSAYNRVQITLG